VGNVPPPDADLSALSASLQSDARDSAVFFGVLCATLETALPERTTVGRERKLFGAKRPPRTLVVRLGDDTFEAEMLDGRMRCRHLHAVHGVGGGLPYSKELGVDEWVDALTAAVAQDAQASAAATAALRSLAT
jgi:hypothetical protein